MIQNLKIFISKPGKTEPDTKITIPLSMIKIAEKLIPSKIRNSLQSEGISLSELESYSGKKGPKGTLIEIENVNEKISIMVE